MCSPAASTSSALDLVTLLRTSRARGALHERRCSRAGRRASTKAASTSTESPLTLVDKIERPLLIAKLANDPRVKISGSDQIVAAMDQQEIPVTYVVSSASRAMGSPVPRTTRRSDRDRDLPRRCRSGSRRAEGTTELEESTEAGDFVGWAASSSSCASPVGSGTPSRSGGS